MVKPRGQGTMATNYDAKPHAETWHSFVAMVLRASIGVIVVLALMALFLL